MKYFVYYNLHKHCWSLKNWKSKRVEDHADTVVLFDCTFKVSEAGRQRVLKEQRKNVHAGVLGDAYADEAIGEIPHWFDEITYNPYKYSSFVKKSTEAPIKSAAIVVMRNKRVFAAGIQEVI